VQDRWGAECCGEDAPLAYPAAKNACHLLCKLELLKVRIFWLSLASFATYFFDAAYLAGCIFWVVGIICR
jgi:hypothetical protein